MINGKEKFRVDTFFPIIETLYAHLKKHSVAYQEIDKHFSFLFELITIDSD